jgi:transcriptional regulator with XRE-family HTH domain
MITKEVVKVSIGKNVKKYRTERGLNQRELALITGFANSTISDIERDAKMPSVKVLLRLSKALHCSVDDLLKED